jgi:hypothetical protein
MNITITRTVAVVVAVGFLGAIHYASKAPKLSAYGEDIVTIEIVGGGANELDAILPYNEQPLPPLQEGQYASDDLFESDIAEILPEMQGTPSPEEWELPHLTLPPLQEV